MLQVEEEAKLFESAMLYQKGTSRATRSTEQNEGASDGIVGFGELHDCTKRPDLEAFDHDFGDHQDALTMA